MKRLLALTVVAVALLAGCAKDGRNTPNHIKGSEYHPATVIYNGEPLYCVIFDTGGNKINDSGITCDWVRFHEEQK